MKLVESGTAEKGINAKVIYALNWNSWLFPFALYICLYEKLLPSTPNKQCRLFELNKNNQTFLHTYKAVRYYKFQNQVHYWKQIYSSYFNTFGANIAHSWK